MVETRRVTPDGVLRLDRALDDSAPLARLLQRLDESRARLAAIRDHLPEPLRAQVRAGPLDDSGWTLLVPSGAAAAKLRQLQPLLLQALHAQGLAAATLRVRIQPPPAAIGTTGPKGR